MEWGWRSAPDLVVDLCDGGRVPVDEAPSARVAAAQLSELGRLRARARADLGLPWFPMLTCGALVATATAVVALAGPRALLPAVVVASVLGMLATWQHYRARALRAGVGGRRRRPWALAWVMCTAGAACALLGSPTAAAAAAMALTVAGYGAFSVMLRDVRPVLAAALPAAVGTATLLAGAGLGVVLVIFGLTSVLSGELLRRASR